MLILLLMIPTLRSQVSGTLEKLKSAYTGPNADQSSGRQSQREHVDQRKPWLFL